MSSNTPCFSSKASPSFLHPVLCKVWRAYTGVNLAAYNSSKPVQCGSRTRNNSTRGILLKVASSLQKYKKREGGGERSVKKIIKAHTCTVLEAKKSMRSVPGVAKQNSCRAAMSGVSSSIKSHILPCRSLQSILSSGLPATNQQVAKRGAMVSCRSRVAFSTSILSSGSSIYTYLRGYINSIIYSCILTQNKNKNTQCKGDAFRDAVGALVYPCATRPLSPINGNLRTHK